MHPEPGNIVTHAFSMGYSQDVVGSVREDDDHAYVRGDVENRGPCPALNALANQGYLPRDGKDLTLAQVEHALKTALHMDKLGASSLAGSLRPLVRTDGKFDLADTRRHDVVEHDSSFTRLDFHEGDNYTFQPHMFEAMIADANGGPVTLQSLAKTFKRRGRESRAAGAPRLGLKLWFVHVLQAVSLMNVAQTNGKLTREVLEAVYVEERFPAVILDNPAPRTLFNQLKCAAQMLWYVVFKT